VSPYHCHPLPRCRSHSGGRAGSGASIPGHGACRAHQGREQRCRGPRVRLSDRGGRCPWPAPAPQHGSCPGTAQPGTWRSSTGRNQSAQGSRALRTAGLWPPTGRAAEIHACVGTCVLGARCAPGGWIGVDGMGVTVAEKAHGTRNNWPVPGAWPGQGSHLWGKGGGKQTGGEKKKGKKKNLFAQLNDALLSHHIFFFKSLFIPSRIKS